MDSNEDSDPQSCIHLWENVMKKALEDIEALIRLRNAPRRFRQDWIYRQSLREIRMWFLSQSTGISSFLWVCDTCDMSHHRILSSIKKKLAKVKEILDDKHEY